MTESTKNIQKLNLNIEKIKALHSADIVSLLSDSENIDNNELKIFFSHLDVSILGDVLVHLSESQIRHILSILDDEKLIDAISDLETDDATDLIQVIENINEDKTKYILSHLSKQDQEEIKWLKQYQDDESGAFMQTELFYAYDYESVLDAKNRLIEKKKNNELENIHTLFLVDKEDILIANISLDVLFIAEYDTQLSKLVNTEEKLHYVTSKTDINEAIKIMQDYDLSSIAVVEYKNRLVGRITSDDVYDIINDSATEQIYNLAGVTGENGDYHDFFHTFRDRVTWLFVNLLTAILASIVIGVFEDTLKSIIALAILMPIVASMGGNAGIQTVTVVVRQLALGAINFDNAKSIIKKEILLSLLNGIVFAVLMSIIVYFWFGDIYLAAVMAMAMVVNMLTSGLSGASVPLILKKLKIDPAVGSSVIITTLTDVIGFMSFLLFAGYFLL